MKHQSHLLDRLPRGLFSISDAAQHGVSHTSLYRMRDAGLIEKIGSGLYIAGTGMQADLDLLEASRKAPLATICLTSALARHELIDE
ncbi:type IV toxin-antitoxin system AbiEi family antitoxin domain-containing protein, partial [Arthrobacter sp. GN70]|uniref:type IV toxin-antitoxin system AbiEi family antitoxin domain-containing protein n=1 Tax=Arthrobacter sp. GN70 TaxID=2838876 RepID=UPI001BFD5CC9